MKAVALLPLLAAIVLTGCITSKTPVGDKVPRLEPGVWNAKWQSGDGGTVRTRVKDAKLGIVTMSKSHPWFHRGEPVRDVYIRLLGPYTVANEKLAEHSFDFGRISIDNDHLVVFAANELTFQKLVARHQIAGKAEKDEHGKPTGSFTIEGFSDKDYRRLKRERFDMHSLFKDDPSMVLIRHKCCLF